MQNSLTQFLIEQQRSEQLIEPELRLLVELVARACKRIGHVISKGALGDVLGSLESENVQGEVQKKLDVIANEIFLEANEWGGHLAALASEEMETIHPVPNRYPKGEYLILFDPIDGSSNVDVNLSVGTIFSVLKAPDDISGRDASEADFLQPGNRQVAAGYAIYGPQTQLVITLGRGVFGFTLDREMGSWRLTHPDMRVPTKTTEYAINASNARHWDEPVRQYIEDCLAGTDGGRESDFNMRWTASMVADVHRILTRGGVFLYPSDSRPSVTEGKLRLLYEANPMAMLIEQAGGGAITGDQRILDVQPIGLHQRVSVILGSADEVSRISKLYEAARIDL